MRKDARNAHRPLPASAIDYACVCVRGRTRITPIPKINYFESNLKLIFSAAFRALAGYRCDNEAKIAFVATVILTVLFFHHSF